MTGFGLALLILWMSRASGERDVLQPYTAAHGSSHSHRHIRDCTTKGRSTYETWPASRDTGAPPASSHTFISKVSSSRGKYAYGHMTVVNDPLRTLSVLEPGGPGGCDHKLLAPVEQTARSGHCLFTVNAGFYNATTRGCLGNVVSDGRLVRNSGGVQNAQFGIRKDGSLVFGYLSEEEVLDQSNPFVQLVSGVVWLLRDGEVYINHSLEVECDENQSIKVFRDFVDMVSARTAIGHDANGSVVLFQVDGETLKRGMSLWEVAQFLKQNGVINAINLDGGGSSSFVINGSLASYPPDPCVPDGRWRCGRAVSTVLCVHSRRCEDDCSNHGLCQDGLCVCESGWSGATCDRLKCEAPGCGPHGLCTEKGCVCEAGWTGDNCTQVCPAGSYGPDCKLPCVCLNGGLCNSLDGHCICSPGYRGNHCEKLCPPGFYGPSCARLCACEDLCPCHPQTGSCASDLGLRHKKGVCLGPRLFKVWMTQQERDEFNLFEQYCLLTAVVLASLLLARPLLRFIRAARRWILSGQISPTTENHRTVVTL